MKANVLALTMACAMVALPAAAAEVATPIGDAPISVIQKTQLSQAMADLGLAVLREQAPTQNSMNSPYSVTNAMGMVLLGANGNSAQQLAKLLQGGSTQTGLLARHMGGINPALASASEQATLRNANRMWLNTSFSQTVLPTYAEQTRQYYQSDAVLQSFANPEQAVPPINAWIEEKTGGKIANMLSPAQLSSQTQMVLVNAVYFKGQWSTPFPKERTAAAAFTLDDGSALQVPTMHATVSARTAQQDGVQWLELPYGTEASRAGWVMQIALPPRGQSLAKLQQKLSGAQWQAAMANMQTARLAVDLPRFSMKGATSSLREPLKKQGVVDIFSGNADLSGINGSKNLLVDDVFHRATIDVDEAGSVASAATAVTMSYKSIEVLPRFVVDRPFLFFIVHKPTQTPVFVGRVLNPASSN